jgi:hypothetical protein
MQKKIIKLMAGNPREMIIQPLPDEKSQLTARNITVQN